MPSIITDFKRKIGQTLKIYVRRSRNRKSAELVVISKLKSTPARYIAQYNNFLSPRELENLARDINLRIGDRGGEFRVRIPPSKAVHSIDPAIDSRPLRPRGLYTL